MRQQIGIYDYGFSGNVFNIKKALALIDSETDIIVSDNLRAIEGADKIILPGVGSYPDAMDKIGENRSLLCDLIHQRPTLGICLGMQILSKVGYEFENTKGLGLIEGEVMKLSVSGRIPHIGWAAIEPIHDSRLLQGIDESDSFYFMHSYEFISYKNAVGLSEYCDHQFVAALEKDNLFGVQFHPEKSRESGFKVLRNFLSI